MNFRKLAQITGHSGSIYSLHKSFTNAHFLSYGADKMAVEWNLSSLKNTPFVVTDEHAIYSCSTFKINNIEHVLLGNSAGELHLIDYTNKTELRNIHFHNTTVFASLIWVDPKLAVTADASGTICLWNLEDFSLVNTKKVASDKIRCLSILKTTSEEFLLVGSSAGELLLLNQNLELVTKHQFSGTGVTSIATINDSQILVGTRNAYLYNVNFSKYNFEIQQSIPAHNYAIYSIVLYPEKNLFFTASRDKTIKMWDLRSLKVIQRIDRLTGGHKNSVNTLLLNKEENKLLSAGDDKSIIIWELLFN